MIRASLGLVYKVQDQKYCKTTQLLYRLKSLKISSSISCSPVSIAEVRGQTFDMKRKTSSCILCVKGHMKSCDSELLICLWSSKIPLNQFCFVKGKTVGHDLFGYHIASFSHLKACNFELEMSI